MGGEEAAGEKKVEEKRRRRGSLAAGLSRRSRPSSICITGIYRQRGRGGRLERVLGTLYRSVRPRATV